MSRGPGYMQQYLFKTIMAHGRPITFAELRRIAIDGNGFLTFSEERSLRRALHTMVRDGAIIALGKGGRADPHRYAVNPMVAAMAGINEEFEAACKAIEGGEN